MKISDTEKTQILLLEAKLALAQKDIQLATSNYNCKQTELQLYISNLYVRYELNETYKLTNDGEFISPQEIAKEQEQQEDEKETIK